MTSLTPQPPFVFPEPRVAEAMASYEQNPPYDALVLASQSLFGIVSGVTESGINALRTLCAGLSDNLRHDMFRSRSMISMIAC